MLGNSLPQKKTKNPASYCDYFYNFEEFLGTLLSGCHDVNSILLGAVTESLPTMGWNVYRMMELDMRGHPSLYIRIFVYLGLLMESER